MDAIHFPACSSGASAAPQTFTVTAASYWHWTSTSLHSIGFINSFLFFFFFFFLSPKRNLQSTARPHQSTARPLERAASHIKVTHPPCLFQLSPWENVNRSTTLIHHMWVMSSQYFLFLGGIIKVGNTASTKLRNFSHEESWLLDSWHCLCILRRWGAKWNPHNIMLWKSRRYKT